LAGLGFAWLALDGPLAEVFNPDRERTTTAGPTTISALTSTLPSTDRSSTDARLEAIQSALGARGSEAATVERDGSIIRLTGSAASEAERQAVLDAVEALVEPGQLDASGFVVARIDPSQRRPSPSTNGPGTGDPDPRQTIVARELERLLDATPVAFGTGESALEPLHLRILNNVALVLAAYPDLTVSVIGFPDTRTPDGAGGLSQTRADAVRDYLVAQGIDPENLVPAGWDGATPPPSDAPLGHVEFRVGPS
jgi:outer membrane protein OmpA-like peptidoglycan-associated protein